MTNQFSILYDMKYFIVFKAFNWDLELRDVEILPLRNYFILSFQHRGLERMYTFNCLSMTKIGQVR